MIWTPNEADSRKRFLLSKADGMITGQVSQAFELIVKLEEGTDFERIPDGIFH